MLPILDVPITARIIEQIRAETPIRHFLIVVRSLDQDIAVFLRDNPLPDVEIDFAIQPEALGMADALKNVMRQTSILSDFLLAACDNLFKEGAVADLYRTYKSETLDGAMCLLRMPKERIAGRSAAVYLKEGRIAQIVEKPALEDIETDLASIPLYIFGPKLLDYVPRVKPSSRGEYELQDAIQMLIEEGGKIGHTVADWRRTVTAPEDLLAINLELLKRSPQPVPQDVPGVQIEPPVVLGKECVLLSGSQIGPNVCVGSGSTVGHDCRLSNCVVLPGTTVKDRTIADNKLLH